MSARDAARALALGRLAIGAGLLAAPGPIGRVWIGEDAERAGAQIFARAVGVRELILGALTLHVLDRPGVGYRTVATCALADAVDCAATLAVRERLPTFAAIGAIGLAGGGALAGIGVAIALRD